MPWFRIRKRKSSDDQRPDVPELEAKPQQLDQPQLTDPAADAAGSESTDPTKPKRRRGTRGGRGRKKPGSTAGTAAPERKDTTARKEKAEPGLIVAWCFKIIHCCRGSPARRTCISPSSACSATPKRRRS